MLKTPASIYEAARWICSQPYDHVVVVVDSERSLHISYPRAKLVPTYLFTHVKREPLLIRPNLNKEKIEKFLFDIKHATVGKKYDSGALMTLVTSQVVPKTKQPARSHGGIITINAPTKKQAEDKVICSQ